MNITINTTLSTTGINNPPSVNRYIVRLFKGTAYLRNVTYTAAQAASMQTINLNNDGVGTYSASVVPVGVNGNGAESTRSPQVPLARRTVNPRTTVPRTGRKLAGMEEEAPRGPSLSAREEGEGGAPLKRRGRHLL